MADARANFNWPQQYKLAFDGETAKQIRQRDMGEDADYCSMCGHDWCAVRISKELKERAAGLKKE